jgi:CheY-like chemotaxis protein
MNKPNVTIHGICLIDDDQDHVTIIRRAIRELDDATDVKTLGDGELALAWLRSTEQLPDLILLDINMPGLSGFDVLTTLKSDARLKRVPVVMLTSSDLTADVARAYELGASGYISKPSYLHDLRAVLGNTLLYWSAMRRAQLPDGGA